MAGSTSGTATITALDDTVVEGAETITVEASHDSTVIGSVNVEISANDATDFTVEVSASTIAEGETSEVTVKTGGVTFESDQTIALALSGSATEGASNDYTIAPAAITIVAGSTSGTATITALDDTVVEEAETITVEASHDSTVIGSVDVEISANDATDFMVEVSASTIAEGETSEVTVSTGGVTFESDETIALALSGSATEGASNDYTIAPAAITIVAGSTSGTATITALDDTVVEGAETITVEASHDSTVIGSVNVEISANDATDFTVEVSAATIAEGETSEVTVKTGGVTFETDQTITLALSGDTTEGAGNDYTIAPSAITIVAGSTSGTATITALDETVVEEAETITVEASHDSTVIGSVDVEISANDATNFTVEVSAATIAEGETSEVTVKTGGVTFESDQTIALALSGSATEGASNDYTIAPAAITIVAGSTSGTATITAVDDTVVEGDETITVTASHDSTTVGSANVEITANDPTDFTVEVSASTIAEGETSEVTVSTGGVTFESNQTIDLVLTGSATEGASNDYTIAPAAITIVAGSTSGTATITAVDDTVVEEDETITVEASHDSTVIGSVDVEISANDATTFTVEVSASTIAEGETSEVTVKTGGVTFESNQTIDLVLTGSATEGASNDYTIAPAAITIVAGSTSGTATITAVNDTVVEGDETITVTASHDSTTVGSANVEITANDPTDFTVEVSASTIAEGETSEVTVSTGGVTFESNQTIGLVLTGSATEGASNDYTIAPAAITIVAGSTSGTATIRALDDTVVEEDETITVEASHDSTVIGSVDVEISANDATTFTVEVSASTIAEGETSEVTVKTGGVTFESDQTIALALSGSATEGAGNDYTIAPAAITIVAGSTSGTATITAVDDTAVEEAETITVEASHDSKVIGSVDVEISANDAITFTVEVSASTIAEGETSEVTVKTGGVTFESNQTIDLVLTGSATEGASNDYTIAPAEITIVAGAMSGTATIAALDETVVEEAETITVEASHDSTVIGSVDVEISANDATNFTVEVSAATIAEGETSEVTVKTGGVTFESDQTIALALSGGATEGASNDYTIAPAAITIVAGSTSGTATITAVDDTVVEGDETITVEASHDSTVIGSVDVEISANDGTNFTVEVSAATIAEGETSEVTVKTGGVTFESNQTIDLVLTGSATEGASNDYTIAPAAITIVAGSTSGMATITALDDTVEEEAETITVEASHDSTVIGSVDVKISASDINTAPRFTSTATPSVAENVKLAVTLQATDDDGDDIDSFGITDGADSGMFAIDDNGGLLFKIAPNFEDPKDVASTTPANDANNNQYVVVVTVTSGAPDRAMTAEQTITVTVTDAEEPPLAPGAPEVDTVSITELRIRWLAPANTGPPITDYDYRYRIKTPQGAWATFENETITNFEKLITSLQENTEYQVQVRANNEEGEGIWSESGEGETGENAAPRFTSAAAFQIAENSSGPAGPVTATDDDTEDDVEGYSIVGGVDKLLFQIGATGALSFEHAPNHEGPQDMLSPTPPNDAGNNQYVVVVMVTSGENDRLKKAKQTVIVTVTDVAEPPLTPDAPTVVPASPTSLTVLWSDKADVNRPAATKYHYQHRELKQPPSGTWTEVNDVTTTTATITGLTKETAYEVQVKAKSDEGVSGWSDSGTATTPEMPVVTLVLGPDSIAEDGASTVTATVAPAADAAFAIEVSAAADSGNDADVFELSTNVTLQFAANETASTGTVTISAVDNAVDEDDKTVTVSGTVLAGAEVFAPAVQTLTITDDDVLATVTALESTQCDTDSDPSACVEEGNDALFPVTLTGGTTTAAVVIGYEVTSEDATADVDYTAPSDGLLTIAQGESTGTITVETNGDDDILDPGETLKVTLTSGSTTAGGVQVSDEPATMTIADTGEVNLSVGDAEAAEGDAVNFEVKLSRKVASGVTVSYETANDTAESGTGKDYTLASGTLTFAADAKTMTVAVTTLEDALDESDETFTLTLTAPNLPTDVTLTDGVATGTIQDDDTRGVTVSTDAVTVVKGGDSESYTLRLRSQPTGDVTIDINGPGGGVLVSPTQVTFTPQNWSTTKSVQVSATTDAQADTTSRITHSVSGADYAGQTANHVTVTIQEQTSVGLGLRPKSNTGTSGTAGATGDSGVYTEGETIGFFVERTSSSQEEVTVMVTFTQNGDYMTGDIPTSVTLLPHEKEKDIPIPTEDDAIVEPDGSVTITIACDCAVTTGTLTVDVLNNDAEFAVDNSEAMESEGHITFTVRKRSSLKVAMDLQYETMNGSATAGKDYEQPEDGAMVTILPEQDHATVTIPITDDTLVEGDESFRLRVFHTIDRDFDAPATGTIKDDDAAVAKAWLARFGRTVASHVVEAVDARLTGELGPTTQVTLGGTTLPSSLAPIQPNAVAAMPHTSIAGGAFLAGSSFQVLASESGGGSAGTGLTMWGRGAATGLQASDEVVSSLKGQVGTGTVGVDYDFGSILAGLAVAYSGGGADYKLVGDQGRADEAASWLISAHPYARAQILGDRLTAWGLLGYGLGQMTLAKGSEDETGISMMMGALGLRGVLSPETNRFGLTVKSDAFLTHMTAGEGGLVTTGAHRARLLAEGTYRMDFGAGGVLIPRLVTGVRYDFGDAEEGFGAEMGGGVTYTYPAWGLTASGNLRVLLTHQDSGFEQWGGGGSLRVSPGAAGLGPSVAVNTSLGAPASGAQRLFTSGVAHGSAPAASAAPGAHIDAEMGYGLTVLGGGGMVTPYVGMAVAEKGARAFRLGGRLSVGPAFSLSVEGERREETAGAAAHAVSVNGALRW